MTSAEKKKELALYRLRQSEEAIEEAKYLLEGNKSSRSVMNRIYYAMFYSVLAILVFEKFSSSKHSGVISYFNKKFIKEDILPKELGRSINAAFELRQKSDYKEYKEPTHDQVEFFIPKAEDFTQTISNYLKKNNLI